jgi:molecular chaperone DnaK (HSP70)
LDGIPPAPRGVPQIEVKFDISADGLVSVSATDKATGKEQNITITGSGAMSPHEVEKLVEEAKKNEESDKKKKMEVENKNQLESMIFQSEKLLQENENIEQSIKDSLEKQILSSKEVLSTGDPAQVEAQMSTLSESMQAVGKSMYENQQNVNPEQPQPAPDDDDVIDAEFVES